MSKKIFYCLIAVAIIALPAKELQAEYSPRELARSHYLCARSYYHQGEYSKAKTYLEAVLKLEPEHQGARWYLKSVEKKLGQDKKPSPARTRRFKKTLDSLDRNEQSKLKAKAQAERIREELRLHLAQGKINYYREQYEQAIEEFEQALLIDPEQPSAGKYIRKCQKEIEKRRQEELKVKKREAKRLKRAAKRMQAEEKKEKFTRIKECYRKGKYYLRRGFYSEAIACFEEVIELEGNNPHIYYIPRAKKLIERAKSTMEQEKKKDARAIAKEEIKRRRAEAKQKLQAQEKAQEEARRKEKEAIREHYRLGKSYYRQRNYPMAIAEFNKIQEINPQHPYALRAEKYIRRCQKRLSGVKKQN